MLAGRLSPLSKINGLAISGFLLAMAVHASAYEPGATPTGTKVMPTALKEVGIDEHLGGELNLALPFTDESGRSVTLAQYFDGKKPVILTLVYYGCPSLCNFHLNGLTEVAKNTQLTIGRDYQLVAVSIDPSEGHELAEKKRAAYLKEYDRPGSEKGWHFLTGTEASIQQLAKAVGFKYRWDSESKQWAHTSAAYVITPAGKISRYLYGIDFKPQDLKLALVEAASGTIGTIVDRLVLFCFQFDPTKNRYTLYAYNIMRAGAGVTVLLMLLLFLPYWLRTKREKRIIKE